VGHGGRRQREQGRGKDDPEHGSSLTRGGFGLVSRTRWAKRAKAAASVSWPPPGNSSSHDGIRF
jgi:hypothetical protein